MSYHIIIQSERRTPVETQMGLDASRLANEIGGQLHSMGMSFDSIDNPQLLMVAEWDGVSPYVIQHKGDYSAVTLRYAGWP